MQTDETKPFATIESSLEFMHLLNAAIAETVADVHQDMADARSASDARRAEALQLVDYKLHQLALHVGRSERLLKELRRLRNLIVGEKVAAAATL